VRLPSLAALTLLFASCTEPPPRVASPFDDGQVLAIVGDETITRADFEHAAANRAVAPDALLDELIERRALVQTARERGYDRDPQHLAAVEKLLVNRVREELREAHKWDITGAEIESRYRAAPEKFTVPAKIRAAMIFVECPATFTEEKRRERRADIEAVRETALRSPAQFATLAAAHSYDQATKFRGGDIGYLVEGMGAEELEQEVLAAAFDLRNPGDLSELVSTRKGFYLLRLTERAASTDRPLSAVSAQIRADLQREKQSNSERDLMASVKNTRKIEVRRDRLPKIAPSTASPTPPQAPSIR
jgi:parvulin-like peptidyl-prolyl isomerase